MSEALQAAPGSRRRVSRTRGATSGVLLMLLGAWGALVPFVGPLFDYAFTPEPNTAWHWTAARGWYDVLPGCVALVGGFLLLISTSRMAAMVGAWLGIAAGAWFIIGPAVSAQLTLGSIGQPTGTSAGLRAIESLGYFYLLGAVILFLASAAFGRLSVVTVRDVRVAEQREAARIEAHEQAAQDAALAREVVMRDGDDRRRREAEERAAEEREASERGTAERDEPNRAAAQQHAGESGADSETSGAHAYEPSQQNYGQSTYGYHAAPPQAPQS
jgi:hypothetical protein